jgi:phosphoglycolate phosphatase
VKRNRKSSLRELEENSARQERSYFFTEDLRSGNQNFSGGNLGGVAGATQSGEMIWSGALLQWNAMTEPKTQQTRETMRPAVRALIFDLDGTLIDSKIDLIHAVNATLQELGRERLPPETIAGYIGHGAPKLVARALGSRNEEETQQALKFFLEYYEQHKLDNTCLYPVAAETLAELHRQGVPMAILTNKPVRISNRILDALQAANYFRVVYGGNSFETKKPDPLGAKTIVAELAVSPSETLLVGDSEVDVQTARNAGMQAAFANYGFGVYNRDAFPADYYLDRIDELLRVVQPAVESAVDVSRRSM